MARLLLIRIAEHFSNISSQVNFKDYEVIWHFLAHRTQSKNNFMCSKYIQSNN